MTYIFTTAKNYTQKCLPQIPTLSYSSQEMKGKHTTSVRSTNCCNQNSAATDAICRARVPRTRARSYFVMYGIVVRLSLSTRKPVWWPGAARTSTRSCSSSFTHTAITIPDKCSDQTSSTTKMKQRSKEIRSQMQAPEETLDSQRLHAVIWCPGNIWSVVSWTYAPCKLFHFCMGILTCMLWYSHRGSMACVAGMWSWHKTDKQCDRQWNGQDENIMSRCKLCCA